jgi:GNAT superfamily N-acetyltransferase
LQLIAAGGVLRASGGERAHLPPDSVNHVVVMNARLQFRIAETEAEFEAIHRLNYRTFVEEIPQHAANAERRLVDRFHAQNTYFICVARAQLVGMLALRTQRPFSLDEKLADLDTYLPEGGRIGEVRLLAVEPQWRKTGVMAGLARLLERECFARELDMLIVSATTRERRFYRHLGFEPFGPLVGGAGAWFQPMRLGRERFLELIPTAAWRRQR